MSIPECGVPCSATAEIINDPLNLLDDLIRDSLLYKNSKNYKELLDFVVKFRNVSPFNAMLLQIQKPGLTFAATLHDWQVRYRRYINEGTRPLVILWPFGPVAFVYDVADTDGEPLPEDILECQLTRWKPIGNLLHRFKDPITRIS